MSKQSNIQQVAPNSVHVWRGYKLPGTSHDKFASFLGEVFVPACSLLQPNAGLTAYVPSLPDPTKKPEGVPDQTALMFWTKPEAHKNGFKVPAVRTYTHLHGLVYDDTSKSQFPETFLHPLKTEQPYYLIDQLSDWMHGTIYHFIGAKNSGDSLPDFLDGLSDWAAAYKSNPPDGVDGGLLCAGENYVVFWEHHPVSGSPSSKAFEQLSQMARVLFYKKAEKYTIPAGLWTSWEGIDLQQNDCINIQLIRPIIL